MDQSSQHPPLPPLPPPPCLVPPHRLPLQCSLLLIQRVCVDLLPSLAFVETIWPIFWLQTHSWDLAPSFLGTTYSGNTSTIQYFQRTIPHWNFWFRKAWFSGSGQWEMLPTYKIYCHEKHRPSRKKKLKLSLPLCKRRLRPGWVQWTCSSSKPLSSHA